MAADMDPDDPFHIITQSKSSIFKKIHTPEVWVALLIEKFVKNDHDPN